eukprot:788840_1
MVIRIQVTLSMIAPSILIRLADEMHSHAKKARHAHTPDQEMFKALKNVKMTSKQKPTTATTESSNQIARPKPTFKTVFFIFLFIVAIEACHYRFTLGVLFESLELFMNYGGELQTHRTTHEEVFAALIKIISSQWNLGKAKKALEHIQSVYSSNISQRFDVIRAFVEQNWECENNVVMNILTFTGDEFEFIQKEVIEWDTADVLQWLRYSLHGKSAPLLSYLETGEYKGKHLLCDYFACPSIKALNAEVELQAKRLFVNLFYYSNLSINKD